MKGLLNKTNWEKNLFQSYHCVGCKQKKPCGTLTRSKKDWERYCCGCYYASQSEQATGYNSYEEVLGQRQIDREKTLRQCQLLQSYRGCPQCGSKEVDAYSLFEESRLVCQPCLAKKEGGSSSPVSFAEQSKWYQKRWGISLNEWLENYGCLPVNVECAKKWLKDKRHLEKCGCLEQESREIYLLFSSSLQKMAEQIKDCRCEESEKVRVDYLDSEGSGWIACEKCETRIESAGHHGVIKNRNDPKFWGLEVVEKVLCGDCLANYQGQMPVSKKYTFWKYLKRGYYVG